MPATANERLAAARTAVDQACQLLLDPTPRQMDVCACLLKTAIAEIRNVRSPDPPALPVSPGEGSAAFDQARLLKISIGRAARLLQSAAAFHANWLRCLSALCAGYTGQGQPAPLERGVRLLAQG